MLTAKRLLLISQVTILFLCLSCAVKKPKAAPPLPGPISSTTPIAQKPAEEPVKEPTRDEPLDVTLVLGGAGVASFATVGILKRFQQEGIKPTCIVATGWPALFALGSGFLRSVHDLEWFAMRLKLDDFVSASLFGEKDFSSHDKISKLVSSSFKQQDLRESRIPLVLTASNIGRSGIDWFDKGQWQEPLLKSLSVPGIHQPYPQGAVLSWIASTEGIDVELAIQRGAKTIVVVEMYEDYLRSQNQAEMKSSSQLFRRLYLSKLASNIQSELGKATIRSRIALNRPPADFSVKREAIRLGYQEAQRIVEQLRAQ